MRINTKERLGNKASTHATTARVCVLTYSIRMVYAHVLYMCCMCLLTERALYSLQSAQRKAVVRSFFLPLERSRLGGGNVARMVRDIESSSATPAQQREAVVESEPLSSSSTLPTHRKVPPSSADEHRKVPPSSADEHHTVPPSSADKCMEQFFSSLLAKVCWCLWG